MIKKIFAVLMVLVMVFGLCSVAMAEETKQKDRQPVQNDLYVWVDMRTGFSVSINDGNWHEWSEHLTTLDHYQFGDDVSTLHVYFFGYGLKGKDLIVVGTTQQERGASNSGDKGPVIYRFVWRDYYSNAYIYVSGGDVSENGYFKHLKYHTPNPENDIHYGAINPRTGVFDPYLIEYIGLGLFDESHHWTTGSVYR